jgi:hypothetical protein
MKLVISVGQVDWLDVKDLTAREQFQHFADALLSAISRVGEMKRKPRDFDFVKFLPSARAKNPRTASLSPARTFSSAASVLALRQGWLRKWT